MTTRNRIERALQSVCPSIFHIFALAAGFWLIAGSMGMCQDVPKSSTTAADTTKDKQVFMRIENDDSGTPKALQVAIGHYEIQSGPNKGAKIDLIGAVHIGAKDYYKDLNKRFKSYDALLYELVAESNVRPNAGRARGGFNPIGSIQTGMRDVLKLAFQLEEINYHAKNFVHADMSPDEFGEDMEKRKDGFVNMFARLMGASFAAQSNRKNNDAQAEMMAAMMSSDTIRLRRALAKQFETMDNQMAGIADKSGKSTLLTERNTKAFKVMERELNSGHKSIGIFYGAGHLLDMHARLLRDYDAKQTSLEWLDAWDLQDDSKGE